MIKIPATGIKALLTILRRTVAQILSWLPTSFRRVRETANLAELAIAVPIKNTLQAPATRRAYGSVQRSFAEWCAQRSLSPLPASPETLAAWLMARAEVGRKYHSLAGAARAAIKDQHERAGHLSPTDHPIVLATLKGIAQAIGTEQTSKAPLTAQAMAAVLSRISTDTLGDIRDRALLAFGQAVALHRSELARLTAEDLIFDARGATVTVRGPGNKAETIAVPTGHQLKPVAALQRWLLASGIRGGPLFVRVRYGGHLTDEQLTGRAVARIIKARAAAAGLDADDFSGSSLRAGFAASASDHGSDLVALMAHLRVVDPDAVHRVLRLLKRDREHPGSRFL